MAKVMPRLAWMLTNRVWPSGLNVAPANSSLNAAGARCWDQPVQRDVPQLALRGSGPRT